MKKIVLTLLLVLCCKITAYAGNGDLIVDGGFNLLPPGTIVMFGGGTVPNGWLLCDGSSKTRTEFAPLFAAIGIVYGAGDGSTTFNLPDFRGVFPKGAGTTSRDAGKDASGNYYAGVLGAYSQDKMQGHKHQWYGSNTYSAGSSYAALNGTGVARNTGTAISDGANGDPRTGLTTEPQSLGVNFIIKY